MMNDGNQLPEYYHAKFVKELNGYYMPLRIFSVWVFGLTILGLFGFLYSVLADENFSGGLFESPFAKAIMLMMGLVFIGGIAVGAFALVLLPIRKLSKARENEFEWDIRSLTQDDSDRYVLLGMKKSDYLMLQPNSRFIIIILDNTKFVMLT